MRSQPDPGDIAARAAEQVRSLRARIARIVDPWSLYRRLFFSAEGEPTRDAIEFLARIGASSFADASAFDPDPRTHAFNEGRRSVFLEIAQTMRLDGQKLAALSRQIREIDGE